MKVPLAQHNIELHRNLIAWTEKPVLRLVYQRFYEAMMAQMDRDIKGEIIEIGSGIGNFKTACPECIATDIFDNEWIDRIENAYNLSFKNESVSHIILFDVIHHLKYFGSALQEFKRVMNKSGRIIICDPYLSVLGLLVYGIFHHEPVGLFERIQWSCPPDVNPNSEYYAAQGNSLRLFANHSKFRKKILEDWNIISMRKYSAISYILSGGFSKPSFYGESMLTFIRKIEYICDIFPWLFATRVIIVLEKK